MIVLHGIPNCDTVKKAKSRLAEYGMEFEFRDFKKQAPSEAEIRLWLEQVPLEILLNKRGTTWRKLDALMQEEALSSKEGAEDNVRNAKPYQTSRTGIRRKGSYRLQR